MSKAYVTTNKRVTQPITITSNAGVRVDYQITLHTDEEEYSICFVASIWACPYSAIPESKVSNMVLLDGKRICGETVDFTFNNRTEDIDKDNDAILNLFNIAWTPKVTQPYNDIFVVSTSSDFCDIFNVSTIVVNTLTNKASVISDFEEYKLIHQFPDAHALELYALEHCSY